MDGLALIVTTRAPTWRVALRELCEAGDERGREAAQDLLVEPGTPIGEIILGVRCLRRFAPTEAGALALAARLGHPVPRVREEAARALIQAPHEAALPGLVQALESSDSFRVRLLALTAIARVDNDVARSSLASIGQSHDDDPTREAARRLLEDPEENLMVEYHMEVEEERRGQHRILYAD